MIKKTSHGEAWSLSGLKKTLSFIGKISQEEETDDIGYVEFEVTEEHLNLTERHLS